MAIKINFDSTHNPEMPTFILAKKNGDKIGQLNAKSIDLSDSLNAASEISFNIHKYVNGKITEWWEQIVNFKLIHCVEWDVWFEITVELDEATETIKTVSCTRLGHAELSQIKIHTTEINTENDIAREDYKIPTVFYNPSHPEASLLDRIMEKAPHYSIIHVDESIRNIQRTFSFDDISIYDAFQQIAEEIHCIFILHSNSDENGNIARTISVYDLESNCLDCGCRGEFFDSCPECNSKNIDTGYGKDTTIFVTAEELADSLQLTTDTGAIKNCFKLEAGDDLMTATIRNCNPNGTDYLWYFSDSMKADMSKQLLERIDSYDKLCQYYQTEHIANLNPQFVTKYNALVKKYQVYKSELEEIAIPIKGYPNLMTAYYNTIDFGVFLQSSLMPSVEMSDTSAAEEAKKLTATNLSPVAVTSIANISVLTADNAVLAMAKIVVDSRYRLKVNASSLSSDGNVRIWTGSFLVENYSDEEDTAISDTISVIVNDDYASFVNQKIQKLLSNDDADDLSISGLFAKEYDDFVAELKKYSLDCLNSFLSSCQGCIDILIEQGIGSKDTWSGKEPNLYNDIYIPYINKLSAIEAEIKIRQSEIDLILGSYNVDGELISDGIQTYIINENKSIHNTLNFENYLGDNLWLEFCAFRREDKYSNSNYVSDGLNNAELFKQANEFIKVAKSEIYKSAELQHSISTTLKNLLVIKKFLPLVKDFQVGNWLRVMIDDEVYRLRLIQYSIDFDNLDNISVDFSDVIKANSSTVTVQEVIEQASSMATSYSSVQRQAQKGEKSNDVINNWTNNGLDATNTRIIGGADNQTQTWDRHGMLFRKYDAITDSYDDIQLKIINSTIAITEDNWRSVETAIGAYYYFDPKTNKLTRAYGVNAGVVVGRLILGEHLGIYNKSGSLTFDDDGFAVTNGINTVTINPNNDSIFNIKNQGTNVVSFDDNGNLVIVGNITATSLTLLDGATVGHEKVVGLSDVAISGDYNDLINAPDASDIETNKEDIANLKEQVEELSSVTYVELTATEVEALFTQYVK